MAVSLRAGAPCSALPTSAVQARAAFCGARPTFSSTLVPKRLGSRTIVEKRVVAKASSGEDVDFDKVLNDLADKFEKSDNKAAIIGYSLAAFGGLWVSEWLIHLPGLNFLLGFPIQLLGLLLLPFFSVKYFVDNESITGDAGRAFDRVIKKLPGFDNDDRGSSRNS